MNRKVKNTSSCKYHNIEFKSKAEMLIYKGLIEAGLEPNYEGITFTIWDGYRPIIPFYIIDKDGNKINKKSKLKDITYTPDFTLNYNGYTVVIEVKGFANDVFPYKFKIFRKYIETKENKYLLIEIFPKIKIIESQIKTLVKVIKELDNK